MYEYIKKLITYIAVYDAYINGYAIENTHKWPV